MATKKRRPPQNKPVYLKYTDPLDRLVCEFVEPYNFTQYVKVLIVEDLLRVANGEKPRDKYEFKRTLDIINESITNGDSPLSSLYQQYDCDSLLEAIMQVVDNKEVKEKSTERSNNSKNKNQTMEPDGQIDDMSAGTTSDNETESSDIQIMFNNKKVEPFTEQVEYQETDEQSEMTEQDEPEQSKSTEEPDESEQTAESSEEESDDMDDIGSDLFKAFNS